MFLAKTCFLYICWFIGPLYTNGMGPFHILFHFQGGCLYYWSFKQSDNIVPWLWHQGSVLPIIGKMMQETSL